MGVGGGGGGRAEIWDKQVKIRPESRCFAIFSSLVHWFELHRMIAWEKKLETQNWARY